MASQRHGAHTQRCKGGQRRDHPPPRAGLRRPPLRTDVCSSTPALASASPAPSTALPARTADAVHRIELGHAQTRARTQRAAAPQCRTACTLPTSMATTHAEEGAALGRGREDGSGGEEDGEPERGHDRRGLEGWRGASGWGRGIRHRNRCWPFTQQCWNNHKQARQRSNARPRAFPCVRAHPGPCTVGGWVHTQCWGGWVQREQLFLAALHRQQAPLD